MCRSSFITLLHLFSPPPSALHQQQQADTRKMIALPRLHQVFVAAICFCPTEAWNQRSVSVSPTTPLPCDRKGFFKTLAGATLISTSIIGGVMVESAEAAPFVGVDVYEPNPGSLLGKVMIVTGASSGLGLESSKRLAAAGATIVMTSRTREKGEDALKSVQQYLDAKGVQNPDVYYLTLNLDDFDSINSFARRYTDLFGSKKIDVLMNNAGAAFFPNREITKDGYEKIFQSNHLGPFALTAQLFPLLNRDGARIINVSSSAHSLARIIETGKLGLDLKNLNGELAYDGLAQYAQTKLENIIFTEELQKRADAAGCNWLTTTSLHPGVVQTDIWRYTYVGVNREYDTDNPLQRTISKIFYGNLRTTEQGANTQVWLASVDEKGSYVAKGQYYDEDRRRKILENFAQDAEKAKLLWEVSEKLSGIEFKVSMKN
jgi:NAD(P)-dependent dehydrogenase (short-subunit alcohol dehydrogenase family)